MVKVFKAPTPFFPGAATEAQQKKLFTFNAIEWAARNRQQVSASDFILDSASATKTLFTVPRGYTLFILSAWNSVETRQAAKATGIIRIPVFKGLDRNILQVTCSSTPDSAALSVVFPGGLLVPELADVEMISSSPFLTSSYRAGIFGYIEPNPAV